MGSLQTWMFFLCERSSKQKDKSVLVLFLLNMEIMEGRSRFVTFNFFVRRRHGPLRMPPAWQQVVLRLSPLFKRA